MGNYSVYVYKTITDYMRLYPKGQPDISETHVEGMYLGNTKFVVVTDLKEKIAGYKPTMTKTLVYYNGGVDEFDKKYAKDLQHVTDVKYFIKNNAVEFEGESYGIKLPCAKYVGEKPDGDGFWFTHDMRIEGTISFDEVRNRLNLIVDREISDDNS